MKIDEVDKSRLTRDYIKYPLKKGVGCKKPIEGELPFYEDLKYLYIECNITREELLKYFNCSASTFKRWCSKLGIKKPTVLLEENTRKKVLEKYGIQNVSSLPFVKDKVKKTKLLKYGDERYNNKDKAKKTNIERYGVEWTILDSNVKLKIRLTNLKNHNNQWNTTTKKHLDYMKSIQDLINEKTYLTKKKNNSYSSSEEETYIYNLLCKKYKTVYRNYKSSVYPFVCDFYIPIIDTYIEYNGFWTHGLEPYKGTKEQIKKLKYWELKSNNKQYKKAINDWTIRDNLKRETAQKNGINFLEFFNIKQFMKWYNKKQRS